MQVGSEGHVVPGPQSPPPIVTATDSQAPADAQANGETKPTTSAKAGTAGDGKTMVIPHSAMTRIKNEERERGRKSALEELAKAEGFESVDKMLENVRLAKAGPEKKNGHSNGNGKPQPNTNGNGSKMKVSNGKGDDRAERLRKQYEAKMQEALREKRKATSENRKLKSELDAKDAEMALRELAVREGVRDVDYAQRLLMRELNGKSEEELAKFDEAKWYANLRTEKPYLFGEVVKPATTGTGSSGTPSPRPGEVQAATAQVNQVDARKLSREDYHKRLAAMGLTAP